MSDYLNATDTAKLLRATLKSHFPGVKFSIRSDSYSMGCSVDVKWFDGPTEKQVENVAKCFDSNGFDGMIDLAYSLNDSILPDGRRVHFSPHVSCDRDYSPETASRIAALVGKRYNLPPVPITTSSYNGRAVITETHVNVDQGNGPRYTLADMVYQELHKTSFYTRPKGGAKPCDLPRRINGANPNAPYYPAY